MKIVVNRCYGGFGLSPEATLKLYERGVKEIAMHIDEYWPTKNRDYKEAIADWHAYLRKKPEHTSLLLHFFSPDEQFVLHAGHDIARNHPELIRVVEEMGEAANGRHAALEIVEIPDGIDWEIEEYDGMEWISEKHRTW